MGLDGVGGKVLGNRNIGNIIHATFQGTVPGLCYGECGKTERLTAAHWSRYRYMMDTALAAQRTPQEVARDRGLKLVDLSHSFEKREHVSRGRYT